MTLLIDLQKNANRSRTIAKYQEFNLFQNQCTSNSLTNSLPLAASFQNETNIDGLSHKASVEFTPTASRAYQGKKLQCVIVTSGNQTIISTEEKDILVLCKYHT